MTLIASCICSAQVSAQSDEKLGSASAKKSVVTVIDDESILTKLEVKNNGSVPVFKIKI
jgi:hypothetical protein